SGKMLPAEPRVALACLWPAQWARVPILRFTPRARALVTAGGPPPATVSRLTGGRRACPQSWSYVRYAPAFGLAGTGEHRPAPGPPAPAVTGTADRKSVV